MEKESLEQKKKELYNIIFKTDTIAGRNFDISLLILIFFSVLVSIVESVSVVHKDLAPLFSILEWIITALFLCEYIVRIYVTPFKKKYIFSFYGIIDFLAILPSFLALFVAGSNYLIVIRAIRLLRVFRILQLSHFVKESSIMVTAMQRSLNKISLFIFFMCIIVIILGSFMYVIEGGVNPSFANIPKSIYWAIVTITTVGYGDITPITFLGQTVSAVVMLLGYAIIAVPTGIISTEMIKQLKKRNTSCLNCGRRGHEQDAHYCKYCGAKLPEEKEIP